MASSDTKVIVAYVTSWSSIMPDPQYMTHINYAFGHVSETFNGVGIDNENRLRGEKRCVSKFGRSENI